jgi:hypothetical protein
VPHLYGPLALAPPSRPSSTLAACAPIVRYLPAPPMFPASVNNLLYIATNQSVLSVPVSSTNYLNVTTIVEKPDMRCVHITPPPSGTIPVIYYCNNNTIYSTADLGVWQRAILTVSLMLPVVPVCAVRCVFTIATRTHTPAQV